VELVHGYLHKITKNCLHHLVDVFIFKALTKYGVLAQLVEQRTENPCVPSSILGDATSHNKGLRHFATNPFFMKSLIRRYF
jgi:hypothetical protein